MSITATQTASSDARETYYARVDASRGRSAEPAWLTSRRAAAARQLLAEGFPTTRDEEFRFTNVGPVTAKAYPAADVPPARASVDALLAEATVPGLDAHEIVFVNGRFAPELSSIAGIPAGVRLTSLASSIGADPALVESLWDLTIKFPMKGFTALNTALAGDGAILVVDPEIVVDRPIHLVTGVGAMHEGQLRGLRAGDVMVAISYAPYAEETLAAARHANERGARLIALTDSRMSPLAADAAVSLLVSESSTFGFRSLTNTMALVQSLFIALAYRLELDMPGSAPPPAS